MALLERVATLFRANLNDLIDKAEDPEKMLKQVILDMQNQLMQVKTQVAIAIADQQVLVKKERSRKNTAAEWMRRPNWRWASRRTSLARAALARVLEYRTVGQELQRTDRRPGRSGRELEDRIAKLEMKLAEAEAKRELLIAQHRRARAINRAGDARMQVDAGSAEAAFDRINDKVLRAEALGKAKAELLAEPTVDDEFARLEKEDEIERLLSEMKASKSSAG